MRKSFTVKASAKVDAPSEVVYGIIADYRTGHPQILPRPYFEWLEVERGGRGEGTVIRFQMRVLGQTRVLRAAVNCSAFFHSASDAATRKKSAGVVVSTGTSEASPVSPRRKS